jgi:putative transposase
MPWNQMTVMDERCRFVLTYLRGGVSMSELCVEHGISRPTGYKWVERYEEAGPAGLYDRSRAPHHCPHHMDEEAARWLIEDRHRHPHWGARKIVGRFQTEFPEHSAPSRSAVCELFKREGLVHQRRRSKKSVCRGAKATAASVPNQLWTVDFKGQFRTGDQHYCYPLTIMDSATRYLLACHGQLNTCGAWVSAFIDRLYKEHGLPEAVHSDNGSPFACPTSIGGLSRLSVHWLKLGISIERSRPACPQDNPAHERMHRTLKAETTRPPAANLRAQQRRFDHFLAEYNQERPHEALGDRTPVQLYRGSPRAYPVRLPEPEYPGHFEVRRVSNHNGCFKWKGRLLFIGKVLSSEPIGLEEVDEGFWKVYFFNHLLARFDERNRKLIEAPV